MRSASRVITGAPTSSRVICLFTPGDQSSEEAIWARKFQTKIHQRCFFFSLFLPLSPLFCSHFAFFVFFYLYLFFCFCFCCWAFIVMAGISGLRINSFSFFDIVHHVLTPLHFFCRQNQYKSKQKKKHNN